MTRILPIVRREYLERVRSKAFIIGTILGPVFMLAMTFLPALLMQVQHGRPTTLVVLDGTGVLRPEVESTLLAKQEEEGKQRFDIRPSPTGEASVARVALERQIRAGKLDAVLFIPADVFETPRVEYIALNVSNPIDQYTLAASVNDVLVDRRLSQAGLDTRLVKRLTRHVELSPQRLSESGAHEDKGVTFIFAVILVMLIYVAVMMWGQMLMTGVLEEKTSRVVEVVASAVEPWRLLAGKVLGIGAAGLTQLGVWALAGALALGLGASVAAQANVTLPEVSALMAVSFLVFFILGFFLYSLLYAAVGAAVNSMPDAQSLILVIVMPQMLAILFMVPVIQSPDSTLSIALSLFPFTAPTLMFVRIVVLTPPLWQIALSVLLCVVTIVATTWVVARIYRVGILMYGKKPSLGEILRWVRTS